MYSCIYHKEIQSTHCANICLSVAANLLPCSSGKNTTHIGWVDFVDLWVRSCTLQRHATALAGTVLSLEIARDYSCDRLVSVYAAGKSFHVATCVYCMQLWAWHAIRVFLWIIICQLIKFAVRSRAINAWSCSADTRFRENPGLEFVWVPPRAQHIRNYMYTRWNRITVARPGAKPTFVVRCHS